MTYFALYWMEISQRLTDSYMKIKKLKIISYKRGLNRDLGFLSNYTFFNKSYIFRTLLWKFALGITTTTSK